MRPDNRKFFYNFKAAVLLAIPVFITLVKVSGHHVVEDELKIYPFPDDMKIQIMIAGTAAGILYFVIKYAGFHKMVAGVSSRQDFPEVFALIESLCNRLKMNVPEVSFMESSIPNAFVYKHDKKPVLVLTIPLIEILDAKELETVLAHELVHIKNRDMEVRKCSLFVRFALFLNPLVHLIEPFISRSREYLADETAAWVTGAPKKLASALLKVEDYTSTYKERKVSISVPPEVSCFECSSYMPYLFSRSPSTERRIKRLLSLSSRISQ